MSVPCVLRWAGWATVTYGRVGKRKTRVGKRKNFFDASCRILSNKCLPTLAWNPAGAPVTHTSSVQLTDGEMTNMPWYESEWQVFIAIRWIDIDDWQHWVLLCWQVIDLLIIISQASLLRRHQFLQFFAKGICHTLLLWHCWFIKKNFHLFKGCNVTIYFITRISRQRFSTYGDSF